MGVAGQIIKDKARELWKFTQKTLLKWNIVFNTFGKSKLMGFSAVWRVLTLIPHGIRVSWDALGFLFCGPLGLFYYPGAIWALSGNILQFFLGPLGPNLTWFHYVLYFSDIFFLWSVLSFYFLYFFPSDIKEAASRTFGVVLCKKFWH